MFSTQTIQAIQSTLDHKNGKGATLHWYCWSSSLLVYSICVIFMVILWLRNSVAGAQLITSFLSQWVSLLLQYLSKKLGVDNLTYGYLQTVFAVAQLSGGPLFGRYVWHSPMKPDNQTIHLLLGLYKLSAVIGLWLNWWIHVVEPRSHLMLGVYV